MIKLNSGVSRELKGHFILNVSSLRSISNILEKRAKDLPYPCSVIFHVKREDDRFYETTQVDEVLEDANTMERKIEQLQIELRNADPNRTIKPWERDWIASVKFNSKEGNQKIDVASENKDWALLLSDEIEPHIIKTLTATKIRTWLLLLFYFAIAYWLHVTMQAPLHLVPTDSIPFIELVVWGGALYLTTKTVDRDDERITRWIGPESSFNWGEQTTSFNKREKLRQNLFWGVGVAFFISIAASLVTNALFPPAAAPAAITSKSPNATEHAHQ
jgi:hypothetical protein